MYIVLWDTIHYYTIESRADHAFRGGSLRDFLGTSSVRAMPFAYGLAKASQGVLMILDAGPP
jgi:hypothetical protein